jgi:hypothetical protein
MLRKPLADSAGAAADGRARSDEFFPRRKRQVTTARRWWPFAIAVAAYAIVALQQIALPGVYMDAVNPDYMAVRVLNPRGPAMLPWLLPGNWLFDRVPLMITFYHGSQQLWLGLPFFWLFGMSVEGLRLTHAMFGLSVLAAMYGWLNRAGLKPWQAAVACAALAVDPSFSYAFRTQSYITLAPVAWVFLSLYALWRGGADPTGSARWRAASGAFYAFAVVAYFIYGFFLPALILIALGMPALRRSPRAWIPLAAGALVAPAIYGLAYALLARHVGGWAAAWDYFHQTQRAINAFGAQPDLAGRVAHLTQTIRSVFHNSYHHALIFGEYVDVPGAPYKTALLLGAPALLWLRAEWKRQSPVALRALVALAVSYCAVALLFGTRLSGHHFMVLLPIAYAALALGLAKLAEVPPAWRMHATTVLVPFAALGALNAGGQFKEALRLHELRGVGLYSDAINRLAADLDSDPRRPVAYFPDWGLFMPVVFMTGGRVATETVEDFANARKTLCAGRDVVAAFITGDRAARAAQWGDKLDWDAPTVVPYTQADGKVVFEIARFTGNRQRTGC